MQISGTKAIRTNIKPSKPKRVITEITNSQNTKRTYGKPSEQLFPKRLTLSNPNRTKKQYEHDTETLTPKTGNRESQHNYRLGTVSYKLLGGGGGGLNLFLRAQPHPHPQFLKWYKTFSWLFGSHDNPLTRQ